MGARGRKSSAELAVIRGSFGERPEAPSDLTEDQVAIWREVVSSEAANFFKTAAVRSLLCDYCRHRATADIVTGIIDTFKPEWLKSGEGSKRYHLLLKMRDLETRAAGMVATKLRLTNQSRYTPQAAATAANRASTGQKPWHVGS